MRYVLTSQSRPKRLEAFLAHNVHLKGVHVFAQVDGQCIDRQTLVRNKIITFDNQYTLLELGVLMSHLTLWQEAAIKNEPMTIISDNTQLQIGFDAIMRRVLADAHRCDALFWGVDTRWPVVIKPNGMPAVTSFFHRPPNSHDFAEGADVEHVLARLLGFAGLTCYTIFPNGARNLIRKILPVRGDPAFLALPDQVEARRLSRVAWENTSLDVELSRSARSLNLRLCFPPVACQFFDAEARSFCQRDKFHHVSNQDSSGSLCF